MMTNKEKKEVDKKVLIVIVITAFVTAFAVIGAQALDPVLRDLFRHGQPKSVNAPYVEESYTFKSKDFRSKVEVISDNAVAVHVSKKMVNHTMSSELDPIKSQPGMLRELAQINGVTSVFISPYEISVHMAELYTWKELMPQVEKVITKHMANLK